MVNAGAAQFMTGGVITMDSSDIISVATAVPEVNGDRGAHGSDQSLPAKPR